MLDLQPATHVLTELVTGVRDDQLGAPTPCAELSLGDVLDHVDGLAAAFVAAAAKTPVDAASQRRPPDGSRLGADWRTRIPRLLAKLADSWRDPAAWTGMTRVGGVDLPGEVAGMVGLDEVIVHGWDIAMASGQPFTCEPELARTVYEWLQPSVADHPEGTPGLFGPPVPAADDAPLIDRLIGLTGRDPAWRAVARI